MTSIEKAKEAKRLVDEIWDSEFKGMRSIGVPVGLELVAFDACSALKHLVEKMEEHNVGK